MPALDRNMTDNDTQALIPGEETPIRPACGRRTCAAGAAIVLLAACAGTLLLVPSTVSSRSQHHSSHEKVTTFFEGASDETRPAPAKPKAAVAAESVTAEAVDAVRTADPAAPVEEDPGDPAEEQEEAAEMPTAAPTSEPTDADTADCSGQQDDCTKTRCCTGHGLQCYEKNENWASCMANCTPGIDLRGPDNSPWTCKELGKRTRGEIPPTCAKAGEDCGESKCCLETGHACYEKIPGVAYCKAECLPGPDVTDTDSTFWTCKQLGEETPGVADWVQEKCAQPGENCLDKGCCATPRQQCVRKDEGWGECKFSCTDPNMPWKGEGWDCSTIGPKTPKEKQPAWESQAPVADWVADECAKAGEDCAKTQCCAEPGQQCYVKDKGWSACKAKCNPGPDLYDSNYKPWTCDTLGPRTPGWSSGPTGKDPVADWVKTNCSKENEDCTKTRCCSEEGSQCYAKNEGWATCMRVCDPGKHEFDDAGGSWSCDELGPRTPKPWGEPSLFCYSVIVMTGPEPELVKFQIERSSGIAACDEFAVFSTAEPTYLAIGPLGKVSTIQFEPAEITTSKDGTAGNAELFMHCWDAVRNDGRYQSLDWTVKVDPDAVLLPDRLRNHLAPHTGTASYIVNCNKPMLPEGPMMFGALEAFSKEAMEIYYQNGWDCISNMFWKNWGEDWFMGHCLDYLGVMGVQDFGIYSDGVCTGVDCGRDDAAAFHPMKDIASWQSCFERAIGQAM